MPDLHTGLGPAGPDGVPNEPVINPTVPEVVNTPGGGVAEPDGDGDTDGDGEE